MHAEVDTADGVVEDGFPEGGEGFGDTGADGSDLGGDGGGGVVGLAEVAADAVEFFGGVGEGDVIGGVVGEGEVVAVFVVEANGLEGGAAEGGVPGGVCGERGLQGEISACAGRKSGEGDV